MRPIALLLLAGCATPELSTITGELLDAREVGGFYCFQVKNEETNLLCRRPYTNANEDVVKNALSWLTFYGEGSEVVVVGMTEDTDEVTQGIDLVPVLMRVYDPNRDVWLELDLTAGDNQLKELAWELLSEQLPRTARRMLLR